MNVGQPVIMQAANSEAQEPTEDVMDDADVAGLAMGWMFERRLIIMRRVMGVVGISDFRDIQVDVKDNSWSVEAGLRTCQDNSSSIRYGGKDISFIRKNGHILRGGEHICRLRVYS